eukprot:scaffold35787_cov23-Tisochrysis_lutea.AAC.1
MIIQSGKAFIINSSARAALVLHSTAAHNHSKIGILEVPSQRLYLKYGPRRVAVQCCYDAPVLIVPPKHRALHGSGCGHETPQTLGSCGTGTLELCLSGCERRENGGRSCIVQVEVAVCMEGLWKREDMCA